MSVTWTLEYDDGVNPAVEKTLDVWGIDRPVLDLVSLDVDRLSFRIPARDVFADPLFDFESTVTLKRTEGGVTVTWFQGLAMEAERAGTDADEGWSQEVLGPWYWLQQRQHQQAWKTYDVATETEVTKYKTHVFLGIDETGARLNLKATLKQILDRAIANGAAIQYDDSDFPEVDFPIMEFNDITVAGAITNLLRWTPDVVGLWRYDATPNPEFYVARAADLATQEVAAADFNQPVSSFNIRRRRDLERSAVVINYGKTHQDGDFAWNTLEQDVWPDGATGNEHRAVVVNVELAGAVVSYVNQPVETEDIDAQSRAWWEGKNPSLAAADVASYELLSVARSGALPREIVGGSIADWMEVTVEPETIKAQVRIENQDGSVTEKELSEDIRATDAVSQVYSTLASSTAAETTPVGLARAFYDAVNRPQYEGSLTLDEQEAGGVVGLGVLLNVTGGHVDWATMESVVQRVRIDLETGETTVKFGPQSQLGIPDLVKLLQVSHNRFTWTNAAAVYNAKSGTRQPANLPKSQPKENTRNGVDLHQVLVARAAENTPQGRGAFRADPLLLTVDPATGERREMWIQELGVCYTDPDDGLKKKGKIQVVRTEIYDITAA